MNWRSTKFLQACAVQAVGSVALFTGHLDGPTWVAASALALSIYSITNVAAQKVAQGGPDA